MVSSSEIMARGQIPNFSRAKHGERERAAHEAPSHRDRDASFSLREANSSREVSSSVNLHPPFLRSCARAVWQVSSWCGRRERHAGADSTVKMVTNGLEQGIKVVEGIKAEAQAIIFGVQLLSELSKLFFLGSQHRAAGGCAQGSGRRRLHPLAPAPFAHGCCTR